MTSRQLSRFAAPKSVWQRIAAVLHFSGTTGVVIASLLKDTFLEWRKDKAANLAAALAFYTVFSLGPMLIIVIAMAGFFFGPEAAQGEIVGGVRGVAGEQAARVIRNVLRNSDSVGAGATATALGIFTLLAGATVVFATLQDSLNRVWEVMPKPGRDVLQVIRVRFLSFLMVLGVGVLVVALLAASATLAVLSGAMGGLPRTLSRLVNFMVAPVALTVVFAAIYKVLPDAKVQWRDVWVGAAATSALWSLGNALTGLYLRTTSLASFYGAAGSFVIFLLWVYLSAQIFFFGAEFTHVYAGRYGSRILPADHAVRVTRAIHAEEKAEVGQR